MPESRVLDVSALSSNGNGRTPHSDESIWKRLRDAGFDEDSIRLRDKVALIAYIAKLQWQSQRGCNDVTRHP